MAEKSGERDGEKTPPPGIPVPSGSKDVNASPSHKRLRTESENSQESPRSPRGGAFPITVAGESIYSEFDYVLWNSDIESLIVQNVSK